MSKNSISQVEFVLEQLYICRVNHRDARNAFSEKITEIGECEYKLENGGGYCYHFNNDEIADQEDWCESCRILKPLHDEYIKKARQAGIALSRAIRFGKEIYGVLHGGH